MQPTLHPKTHLNTPDVIGKTAAQTHYNAMGKRSFFGQPFGAAGDAALYRFSLVQFGEVPTHQA